VAAHAGEHGGVRLLQAGLYRRQRRLAAAQLPERPHVGHHDDRQLHRCVVEPSAGAHGRCVRLPRASRFARPARVLLAHAAVLASSCTAPLVLTMPLASSLSADVSRALSVTAVVSVAPNCLTGSVLRFRWSLTSPAWDPMASPVVASAFNRSTSSVSLPANTYAQFAACWERHERRSPSAPWLRPAHVPAWRRARTRCPCS